MATVYSDSVSSGYHQRGVEIILYSQSIAFGAGAADY